MPVTVTVQLPDTAEPTYDDAAQTTFVEESCLVVTNREEEPELPPFCESPPYVAKTVTVE
ncbi:MAG: hypothetical protein JRN04_03760 [Nitrososphaerota archaeon]|nr:hypothetical protein [Nitrososphaerota archaeon]